MSEAKKSVLMAMSGGVDSSVSAKLLLDAGYSVTGATMLLCEGAAGEKNRRDAQDAASLCSALGIRHLTLDMRDEFQSNVVDTFCSQYISGLTPNPCVECNRTMKFGRLHDVRREMGFDYLATGHYARRGFDDKSGLWTLIQAQDPSKDQSYFLYSISQDSLAHTLFPLGDMSKPEVRDVALSWGFPCASKGDSQDICFIDSSGYVPFIDAWLKRKDPSALCAADTPHESSAFQEGPVRDVSGRVLGTHRGLAHYTIGQRKGIGIAAPEPLYVIRKDVASNSLVVGYADSLESRGVKVSDVNIIGSDDLSSPLSVKVKTHYRQKPLDAVAIREGSGSVRVEYTSPSRAAAPGQACVFYDGARVVGGGAIAGNI